VTTGGGRLARALAAARAGGRALRDFLRGFLGVPAALPGPGGDADTDPRRSAGAARRALEARSARRGSCC